MTHRLGMIGAGNMAEAIACAAIRGGAIEPGNLIVADPSADRLAVFGAMGATVAPGNTQVVEEAEQVILAVKPQVFPDLAGDFAGWREDQVLISIMAGVRTAKIAQGVGKRQARVVRVMPNTPVLVDAGMAGIALGEHAQRGDDDLAMALFRAGGEAIRVSEDQLDAITAVSGSGPAYVFYLAEAMQRAAEQLGLADHAGLLVRQTIRGAAKLLAESDDPPAELRRKVTSKGGTTAAATEHLDAQKVADAIVGAIHAAEARSRELGR